MRLNLKEFARRIIPLRMRNWLRLILRRHPIELRSYWPDLEIIDLRRNDIVFDVGANIGTFTECVLAYQPWAVIHAFEPIPSVFEEMRCKFIDYSDIFARNIALGRKKGQQILNLSKYDQASSFLEQGKILSNGVFGRDYSVKNSILVPVIALSDYMLEEKIKRVRLLKLDVQGYELEVLKGAETVLANIDYIYLEAHFQELYKGGPLFDDVFEFLNNRSFELLRMTSFRANGGGKLFECDMIFRNRSIV